MLGATLAADEYLERLRTEVARVSQDELRLWSDLIYDAWQNDRFVFIFGNGGSGTTASHMAEDLGKSTLRPEDLRDEGKRRLKVLSLTDNLGWIMAVGNDLAYDQIFVQQLMNYGGPGDLAIAISGSGNSPNVLHAVDWANRHGLVTFGLTGYDGGRLKSMQRFGLHVDLTDMGMVESIHLCLFHWVLNDVFADQRRGAIRQGVTRAMYLGIEIGGTKLQLGVGEGDGSEFATLVRRAVDVRRGAPGILAQIESTADMLLQRYAIKRIGIGFGGPVDGPAGRVIKSHQVAGWEEFALAQWCERRWRLPTTLANDCDAAALAEARFGAGRDANTVFFVTVGTGIGGGLVIGGRIHGEGRPAVAEIGHLRPGLQADRPDDTVEAMASGPGIASAAQARLSGQVSRQISRIRRDLGAADRAQLKQRLQNVEQMDEEYSSDLLTRCGNDLERLTAQLLAQAAADGNEVAREVIDHACQALGWAVAQVVTLVAPNVVVVGGGVSLMGDALFLAPLRRYVGRYVFPPLADSYQILPAALGEEVVVHGALALARP